MHRGRAWVQYRDLIYRIHARQSMFTRFISDECVEHIVTLSTWSKDQWLPPLLCTRPAEYLPRRGYSLPIVVEEEKHGTSASIQAVCFLGGAMPVAPHMPFGKERMVHNSRFRRPGEEQHPHLSILLPWKRTPGAEAFPVLFFRGATLPKAVEWLPVPSSAAIADTVANALTFLRLALSPATRTLFSCQGAIRLFFVAY